VRIHPKLEILTESDVVEVGIEAYQEINEKALR
jgi:hypothetical protein